MVGRLSRRRVVGRQPGRSGVRGYRADRSTWEWSVGVVTPSTVELPRKEVIQPHLPVRLPCYDFVPIASPALDGCPPSELGLAHRLQAFPTFMT